MQYRGIVFDFNGVLFFDADLQVKSWQLIARQLRGREMTDAELTRQMHGRPNAYVLRYLAGRELTAQELTSWMERKESYYRNLCLETPDRLVLSPGAEDLLAALAGAGIARTIATSSEITNVRFFIEHLRLDRWFDVDKLVYDDGSRPGKPAPDVYLAAAQRIGVAASGCVVVEDALSGVESAAAAGIGCIVGIGAAAHARLLESKGAARVIDTLRDFPRELLLRPGP
jgi:HAD superfamily hydrolase (TIGR01509 family)